MTKAELESKHIAELHALAAERGVPGYRMLRREELVEKLSDGRQSKAASAEPRERKEREPRRPRERAPRKPARPKKREAPARAEASQPEPEEKPAPAPAAAPAPTPAAAGEKPKRRRRRRFGRRSKTVAAVDLLLPPPGRQALVHGEGRAACSALLLELAAGLSGASKGPDPIALLVDPSPEELASWRREVPQAEIVAAGKSRHASDALAQAVRRAEGGEDVVLLVDSLSRLDDAEVAQEIFDGGLGIAGAGSLTVVAALERQV